MAGVRKYSTDEERLKAYKEQQNNYSKKKWICETCTCVLSQGNKTKHLRSIKHLTKLYEQSRFI